MPKKTIDSIRLEWSSRGTASKGRQSPARLHKKELVLPCPSTLTTPPAGRLIGGDNLKVMASLIKEGLASSAELIYIDPPFLSKTDYTHKITIKGHTITQKAYGDKWSREAYLNMLAPRLALMRELLTETGVVFVHCDWRASGLIRLLLDEIFGADNFMNEIIWHYGGRGAKAVSGQFARNHDSIFVYGKSPKAKLKKIYTERLLTEKEAVTLGFRKDCDNRFFKTAPRGDYTDKSIERLEKESRVHRTRSGKVRIKYFLESRGGLVVEQRPLGDVWDNIPDAMHSPLKERTDYGTQKPVALLKRIIECATNEGDLVCDFFGGSGTTAAAAIELGRRWISTELGPIGLQVAKNRLADICKEPFSVECLTENLEKDPAMNGNLKVSTPIIKTKKDGGYSVEITLEEYKVEKEASKKIPEELIKDPLSLIDSWAIDWDYDGKCFCSMWRSSRGAGKDAGEVSLKASVTLKKKPTHIAIRAIDIMGVESEAVFNYPP